MEKPSFLDVTVAAGGRDGERGDGGAVGKVLFRHF